MLIDIFLPLSLVFIMFTLGLGLTTDDFKKVLTEPKAFAVGLTNQMVLLPVMTFLIISTFGFSKELAAGMMLLACCPGGVTSNLMTKLAKGDVALSISYTAFVSIATVITLPIITGVSMLHFMGKEAPPINVLSLCLTMFLLTAVPVTLGLLLHHKAKLFSEKFEPKASRISTVLFVVIVLGALASEWDAFINNLSTLGPGIVVLIAVMLLLGYGSSQFFKMSKKRAVTVAIESGIQNATVGITVGNLIMNTRDGLSVLSLPSGVYGILMYLVCLPAIYFYFKPGITRR